MNEQKQLNKLTDWVNEPTVIDLKKDFEVAK